MLHLSNKKIATPRTFRRSILSDAQVYHWFLFLINRKALKQKLATSSNSHHNYKILYLILISEAVILTALLALLTFFFRTKDFIFLWPALLITPLLIVLHYPKKEAVASIGMDILSSDFSEEELSKITLYQIGELYGRQHSVISLVDYIVILDRISQRTILVSLILIFFLRPTNLTSYQALAAFPAILLVVNALSKAIVPYVLKD